MLTLRTILPRVNFATYFTVVRGQKIILQGEANRGYLVPSLGILLSLGLRTPLRARDIRIFPLFPDHDRPAKALPRAPRAGYRSFPTSATSATGPLYTMSLKDPKIAVTRC